MRPSWVRLSHTKRMTGKRVRLQARRDARRVKESTVRAYQREIISGIDQQTACAVRPQDLGRFI